MAIKLRDKGLLAGLREVAKLRKLSREALVAILVAKEMAQTSGRTRSWHLNKIKAEYRHMLRSTPFPVLEKLTILRTLRHLTFRHRARSQNSPDAVCAPQA